MGKETVSDAVGIKKGLKMQRRLLLIDGTNFFFKGAWGAATDLTCDGASVRFLYAFYQNLCSLLRAFEEKDWDVTAIVCWDGGHAERTRISTEAVKARIIPKTYKQERREAREALSEEEKQEKDGFIRQIGLAEEMLSYTRIGQCRVIGEEADDLVGSFCKQNLSRFDEIVLVTTDKDYYQLLWDKVRIYNSSKKEFIDKKYLQTKYGLDCAEQWVEVGALAGESGASSDTIYGVPGIGIMTACKLIQQYKSVDGILQSAKEFFKGFLAANGYDKFKTKIRAGEFKPSHLREAKVLAYQDVLEIALKLKAIHTDLDIPFPEIRPDWRKLEEFFNRLHFQFSQKNFGALLKRTES